ncbi:MAG: tRNA (guanosine(46)-N7)-methyltransferase TrmB [Acidiferrobacter sp.]
MTVAGLRGVHSYVRRERPLKDSQRSDLARLQARYAQTASQWPRLGMSERPVVIEIGFGDGEALLAMAAADRGRDYVGIEMFRTGILRVLRGIERQALPNVRVIEADATVVLAAIPDGVIDAVHLFFPDPWPKARHHKRRLVSAPFADEVRRVLRVGGLVHMATDWAHYADAAAEIWATTSGLHAVAGDRGDRPLTRFERRGARLGHTSRDLRFIKTAPPAA